MRVPALFALGLLSAMVLMPTSGESKLYYDAVLLYNPPENVRLHYAQASALIGTEIQFADYTQVFGIIETIYDETVMANADGVVEYKVEFQTYDAFSQTIPSDLSDPNSPFFQGPPGGGEFGGGGSIPPPSGVNIPRGIKPLPNPVSANSTRQGTPRFTFASLDRDYLRQQSNEAYWRNFPEKRPRGAMPAGQAAPGAPSPLQSAGGGDSGGGGGDPRTGAPDDDFEITPILETELDYTIAQNGRLLNLTGLDLIGDIINPSRNITVRQIWQSSHFLILPDGPVHVGESWKGPWFWTIPFVGETMEIPMTYTLEGIQTLERFRVAIIAYSGLKQFESSTMDENTERRVESDIQGDLTVQGKILFDIDRGVVIAVGDETSVDRRRFAALSGQFPVSWQQAVGSGGLVVNLTLDRIDTSTPLGNVLDTEPEDIHKLQELQWVTTTAIE